LYGWRCVQVLTRRGKDEEVDDAEEGANMRELDYSDKRSLREGIWRKGISRPRRLRIMRSVRIV